MTQMFYKCHDLFAVDLSDFNIENTEYLDCMFYECPNLRYLNLSDFKLDKKFAVGMLYGCNIFNNFMLNESIIANLKCLQTPVIFSESPYYNKNILSSF